MSNHEFNNQITAILAAFIGLFLYLNQIFPELKNNLYQANNTLILLIPLEYQTYLQTLINITILLVASIVYVYNYTTSIKYAENHNNTKKGDKDWMNNCNEHTNISKTLNEINTKIDKLNQDYIKFTVQKTLENGYRDKLIQDTAAKIKELYNEDVQELKNHQKHYHNRIESFTDRLIGGILLAAIFELITKFILH